VRGDAVLESEGFPDKPWRTLIGFPVERVLKKRSEVKLAVHLAVTTHMLLVDKSFIARSVVETDEIACKRITLDRAVRTLDHWEFRLLADRASRWITVSQSDDDVFAWEKLALELVVHPIDCEV
jgi:hypothetical protein